MGRSRRLRRAREGAVLIFRPTRPPGASAHSHAPYTSHTPAPRAKPGMPYLSAMSAMNPALTPLLQDHAPPRPARCASRRPRLLRRRRAGAPHRRGSSHHSLTPRQTPRRALLAAPADVAVADAAAVAVAAAALPAGGNATAKKKKRTPPLPEELIRGEEAEAAMEEEIKEFEEGGLYLSIAVWLLLLAMPAALLLVREGSGDQKGPSHPLSSTCASKRTSWARRPSAEGPFSTRSLEMRLPRSPPSARRWWRRRLRRRRRRARVRGRRLGLAARAVRGRGLVLQVLGLMRRLRAASHPAAAGGGERAAAGLHLGRRLQGQRLRAKLERLHLKP